MRCKSMFFCIVLIICSCYAGHGCKKKENIKSVEMIERIFGISEGEYTIIEEDNSLSEKEYGGGYCVKIKVEKEDVSSFIKKVEEKYSVSQNGYYGRDLGEGYTVYEWMGSVRRTIDKVDSVPKTCQIWIICCEKSSGEYEVKLEYYE